MITRVVVARGEVIVERQGPDADQLADMAQAHQLVANIAHTMGWERASYHRDDPTAGSAPEDASANGAPARPHRRLGLDHRPAGVDVPARVV